MPLRSRCVRAVRDLLTGTDFHASLTLEAPKETYPSIRS